MKILIISALYHPNNLGGGEISIKTIAESLSDWGHEVVVLATTDKKGLYPEVVNGIRVWRAGIRNIYWHATSKKRSALEKLTWHLIDMFNPLMAKHITQVIELEKPDILQLHVPSGWSSVLLRTAKKSGIPTIQVLHAYDLLCPGKLYQNDQRCLKQCLKCKSFRIMHKHYSADIDAVVGISHAALDNHLKFGYFKNVKQKAVIYNARNPEQLGLAGASEVKGNWIDRPSNLDVAYPTETGRNGTTVRFGYLGSISPVKGVELLLNAFAALGAEDAELWIAGMGDKAYVEDLNKRFASKRVRFVGKAHPSRFFRDIDVAIVPSLWDEPLGTVVFEALAFGCPVVGSSRGGIPEMIQVGVNGFVFDPDVSGELASILTKLAKDRDLIKKLAAQSPKSVEKFLSTKRIASDYSNLYARIESTADNLASQVALATD